MVSKLLNKRLCSIHRAANMLCIGFADEKDDTLKYALHIQTQWRFVENGEIVLASRDIYEPYDENAPDDWEYDAFDRPDEMSSIFDVYSKKLVEKMNGSQVAEARLSSTNDITLIFSNSVAFESFIFASRKSENWRLIDFAEDKHTVCYDLDGNISVD